MTIGRRNLVFIGMPGSGKSTVGGVLVAKRLGLGGFIDTDLLIQEQAGRTLQEIVDQDAIWPCAGLKSRYCWLLRLKVRSSAPVVARCTARPR